MDADPQDAAARRRLEGLDRSALRALQLVKFNAVLQACHAGRGLYRQKLAGGPASLSGLEQLSELPFTTKGELVPERDDLPTTNHLFDTNAYVRMHQTSGTHGRPLMVLDTAEGWRWWIDCWQFVLDAAGVGAGDRCVLAFSFGPFVGFWSAFDALAARGALVSPGGGMGTAARLDLIRRTHATTLLCTPTYAQRLADEARAAGIDPAGLGVQNVIVAGEPGGSVPAVRQRIERAWGARVTDHSGASEIGPWGYGDATGTGLHVLETEFIAEFLTPGSGAEATPGEPAELVLTSLGRVGAPVVRYRTGDLVRPRYPQGGPNNFVLLEGGVLGRVDGMLVVRGVNIFPSSIDALLAAFPEIAEYRVTVYNHGAMDALLVEVEDRAHAPARIADALQLGLGLKVEVAEAPLGSLPRTEGKARRFFDTRSPSTAI